MVVVTHLAADVRVQRWLRGRRALAVTAMTITMLIVFVVPVASAVTTLIDHADDIGRWLASLDEVRLPTPPDWLKGVPVVGARADSAWRDLRGRRPRRTRAHADALFCQGGRLARRRSGGAGKLALQGLLIVLLSTYCSRKAKAPPGW